MSIAGTVKTQLPDVRRLPEQNPAWPSGTAAPPATQPATQPTGEQRLRSLIQASRSPYTSNRIDALRNAQSVIQALREPTVWERLPEGMKTIAKLQQEETARHQRAMEDITREEHDIMRQHYSAMEDIQRQQLDIDRMKVLLSAAGSEMPKTAAERATDAETRAYNKLIESYNALVKDPNWYAQPFVAAAETMRSLVFDPDFRSALSSAGGDLRNVLDIFTQTALGIPLSQFAKDIRKSTGVFAKDKTLITEDPLSALVNALVLPENVIQ